LNSVPKEDGVYFGLSRELYDAIPVSERVNWSRLKLIGKSPAHYQHNILNPEEDKEAYVLGRATHHAIYEPELFRGSYVVWDGGRRAGPDWNGFVARAEAAAKTILTESQHEEALAIGRAVREGGMSKPWVSDGKSEVTVLTTLTVDVPFTDPVTGEITIRTVAVKVKCRLDFLANAGSLVDTKTCRDASREAFGKAVINYDYLGQAAFYTDLFRAATTKLLPYRIVAAEKKAPWVVQVYRVTPRQIGIGRDRYRELLVKLVLARDSNKWSGYADEEVDLELPYWADPEDQDGPDAMGLTF